MNIKENWTKYRKHTLIGGLAILAIGGVIYATKKGAPVGKSVNKIKVVEDLQKPNDRYDEIICGEQFAAIQAGYFAEFAEKYASRIAKDPENIVYIIIGTTE